MDLEPHDDGACRTWRLPSGTATWDRDSGVWSRPGLDAPLLPPDGDLVLTPGLGDDTVVVQLETPVVVPPGQVRITRVAWPLLLSAAAGGVVFDTFRPVLTRTLLGPVDAGQVLPAARAPMITSARRPRAWEAELHLALHGDRSEPSQLRRVAFDEEELTLYTVAGTDHLHAGVIHVHLLPGDRAEARCGPPDDAQEVLRRGTHRGASSDHGVRWLLDATRRSLGAG